MVNVAVPSMALTVFSRVQHHPRAAFEASVGYQQVLKTAHSAISKLAISDRNIDACLLAVFLISRYEDATYRQASSGSVTSNESPLANFRHHDGAMALLEVWHARRYRAARPISAIRSAFLRSLPIPR